MISTTDLTCAVCQQVFQRRTTEVERNRKAGRSVYCSRKCAGKALFANIPVEKRSHPENIKADNRQDGLSMYRVFLGRAKKTDRDHRIKKGDPNRKHVEISLEYLKELWELQNGRCPYTGWELKTPKNTSNKRPVTPDMASLDRIDNSNGYVEGNVQFVSLMAQYAKNTFSDDSLVDFCRAVVNHNTKPLDTVGILDMNSGVKNETPREVQAGNPQETVTADA